jgi:hypothetical protein
MKKTFIILSILFFTFFSLNFALAADVPGGIFKDTEGTKGAGSCLASGDCSLCDFLTVFTNTSRWILSVMGGVAMVWFVYAGINFILSLGVSEKVEDSKKMLKGTVLGIVIILGAWTMVNLFFIAFIPSTGQGPEGTLANIWSGRPWSQVEGCN